MKRRPQRHRKGRRRRVSLVHFWQVGRVVEVVALAALDGPVDKVGRLVHVDPETIEGNLERNA